MSLNWRELDQIIQELKERLTGAVLQKLNAPDPRQLQLVLKPGLFLLLDLNRGLMRLHLIQKKRKAPLTPPAWVMKARRELIGRKLLVIQQLGGDRIVQLTFGFANAEQSLPSTPSATAVAEQQRSLVAELFGQGRLLLLDQTGRIVLPLIGQAQVHSVYSKEHTSNGPPTAKLRFGEADPIQLSCNAKTASWYERKQFQQILQGQRRELIRRLSILSKRKRKTLQKRQADLDQTLVASTLFRQAEALKFSLQSVRQGQTRVVLNDPHQPEPQEIIVELDPALSPVENMNRLFSRSRRLNVARASINQRINQVKQELEALQILSAKIAMADSLEKLQCLQNSQEYRELLQSDKPKTVFDKPKQRTQRRKPYRQYLSKTGKAILVGRSGADNHTLTFRIARGHDIWLHTRDSASAHVVVRLERQEQIDEQTLLDAATLAAQHSPFRKSAKVEVTYTRIKNVHPIKSAAPGLVSISKAKTILVRIEAERLQRLQKQQTNR